jgi:rRNA pseudouridine-1189 N-methylase Emg1 (Nep1/Mra1 family)
MMQSSPFLSKEISVSINVAQCQILKITPDIKLPDTINFFVGGPAKLFDLPKFT